MARTVFTDKFQSEARRQVEIELNGAELPGPPDGIDDLDIDFGPVKRGFAFDALVGNIHAVHSVGQSVGGSGPVFGFAGVIFRMLGIPIGKFDFEFVEAKVPHDRECKVDAAFNLRFDLIWRAEYVSVVLGETANAQQTVENAAALVAINGAEFGKANR